MRRLAGTAALAAALGVVIAGPAGAATKTVGVEDNYFSVPQVTIKKGGFITWNWLGEDAHDVKGKGVKGTPVAGTSFTSGFKTSGTYRRKFGRVGKFNVLCTLHPNSMRMKVVVKR